MYVIDHDNTFVSATDWTANWNAAASDAGDFKYRFGNPAQYATDEALKKAAPGYHYAGYHQFWAAHNITWIGTASSYYANFAPLPGQGNFLIFDNNTWNPMEHRSRIIEWNPYLDADGNNTGGYVDPAIAGYNGGSATDSSYNISNQVTWMTTQQFYSSYISGAQRMPNGNTYITSGAQSHFFEVTPDNEVVWDYVYPYSRTETLEEITNGNVSKASFRSYKIPADHPGLAGKTLVPQGTLTDPDSYSGFGFGGGIGGSGGGGAGGGAGGGGGY
jgi:hypothetical protein